MSEQAADIISYNSENKSTLDYILLIGGWFVSCISLVIICLIAYWAIKIPENSINKLPIINAIKGDLRVEPVKFVPAITVFANCQPSRFCPSKAFFEKGTGQSKALLVLRATNTVFK